MTVIEHPPMVEPVETMMVRLGDVADINPKWSPLASKTDPVSFVGMAQMSDELGCVTSEEQRLVEEVRTGYTAFEQGDLLVAKITPCFENGKIGHANIANKWGAGSTEFHVVRPGSQLDKGYALHFLRRQQFRTSGKLRMTGSGGQQRVPASYVADTKIPLPPLFEQRRIATILDKADHLRTQRREALAHLEALTQSIFNSMFGDPVSNSLNWPTAKLSTLGKLDRGVSKHRPRNDPRLLNGTHPLIQTGDVANSGGYITKFKSTYSDLGLTQSKIWPIGTLCITIAANIAKTGILKFKACFPDSVVGFTADESTVVFVQVWMGFLQKILENNAPESAQKNINLAILRDLDVINPPLELQQTFARRVAGVECLKEQHRAQLAELDVLFASLQHRAFTGKL